MIKHINVSQLIEHPLNKEIFSNITDEKKEALKLSIKQNGLLNPLTVMAFNQKGQVSYYVVSGHNRLNAMKDCGIQKVPCNVVLPKRKGQDLDILICDNLLQRDLSILEKAKAIFYMSENLKLSREEIQKKLAISLRFIQAALQLIRIVNELDKNAKKVIKEELKTVKGINRAVQIAKKIAFNHEKPEKKYTTKEDIIKFLRSEIDRKDKEIDRLKRTIKRRDKEISKLKNN